MAPRCPPSYDAVTGKSSLLAPQLASPQEKKLAGNRKSPAAVSLCNTSSVIHVRSARQPSSPVTVSAFKVSVRRAACCQVLVSKETKEKKGWDERKLTDASLSHQLLLPHPTLDPSSSCETLISVPQSEVSSLLRPTLSRSRNPQDFCTAVTPPGPPSSLFQDKFVRSIV